MNNRYFIFITLMLAAMSCSKVREGKSDNPDAISFRISYPQTKASATAFEKGDAISLYAVEQYGSEPIPLQVGGNYINDEKLSYDGSSWKTDQPLYWAENPCDFYGIYPYIPTISSVEAYPFAVAIDQNGEGYEASDLLFAYAPSATRTKGPVNLQFKHILSKLVVILKKGDKFEGDIPDDIVAHIYNTVNTCTVDFTHGSVEKSLMGERKTILMRKISNERFEAILVPQNLERKTPLVELTMGGIAYLLDYSLSFHAGYAHTVTITLNTSPDQEMFEINIDVDNDGWN